MTWLSPLTSKSSTAIRRALLLKLSNMKGLKFPCEIFLVRATGRSLQPISDQLTPGVGRSTQG
jgi:hypothetical protein